jgi:hypothetical protein
MSGIEKDYAENVEARNCMRNSGTLDTAMVELVLCYKDLILCPPVEGADLGTILIACKLRGVLQAHGLAIVPQTPTPAMQAAWRRGWFLSFSQRFDAMMRSVWPE